MMMLVIKKIQNFLSVTDDQFVKILQKKKLAKDFPAKVFRYTYIVLNSLLTISFSKIEQIENVSKLN